MNIDNYKIEDRETIREIVVQTAKKFFTRKERHRECLKIMYVDYYMENEPENVFVARMENGEVAGYIEASTNSKLYQEKQKYYIKRVKKLSFVLGIFHKICVNEDRKMNNNFGCGFHINISKKYQGQKIGCILMSTMAKHLYDKGITKMYLITENRKTKGYGFYTHIGFKEVKRYFNGTIALAIDTKILKDKYVVKN